MEHKQIIHLNYANNNAHIYKINKQISYKIRETIYQWSLSTKNLLFMTIQSFINSFKSSSNQYWVFQLNWNTTYLILNSGIGEFQTTWISTVFHIWQLWKGTGQLFCQMLKLNCRSHVPTHASDVGKPLIIIPLRPSFWTNNLTFHGTDLILFGLTLWRLALLIDPNSNYLYTFYFP